MTDVMYQRGKSSSTRSSISRFVTAGVSSAFLIAGLAIVAVTPASAAGLTPTSLTNAATGAAYTATLTAPTAGLWTVSAGALPAGLALTTPTAPASSDTITGSATADGTYNFTVTVTDSTTPTTYTQAYTLTVTGIAPAKLSSPILVNVAYSNTLTVATASSWSVSSGSLPPGLTLLQLRRLMRRRLQRTPRPTRWLSRVRFRPQPCPWTLGRDSSAI
jgi:hypothetical protein